MIYITRPVNETHKTVPVAKEKTLDNNMQERKPQKETVREEELHELKSHIDKEALEEAVKNSNRIIFKDDRRFEFKVHEGTGRMMVKLVDNETDEVIKEIPPEKILDLVASIWDLVGILVDERG